MYVGERQSGNFRVFIVGFWPLLVLSNLFAQIIILWFLSPG